MQERWVQKTWFILLVVLPLFLAFLNGCISTEQSPVSKADPLLTEPIVGQRTEDQPTVELTSRFPESPNTVWSPDLGSTWQWQLDGELDLNVEADVYDIDLFENDASTVTELHNLGRKVICYMSVGSFEEWRPDAAQFPKEVLGKEYDGWPGERWIDIRQIDLLAPLMQARLDLCKARGFDGIEPDNIDGYTNDTGFPLTYSDQLKYNQWLAEEAHARGLSIGLKNNPEQIDDLIDDFDWALTEDCFAEEWCEEFSRFINAGKAVFAAEYTDLNVHLDDFCSFEQESGFRFILKRRDLNAWIKTCP